MKKEVSKPVSTVIVDQCGVSTAWQSGLLHGRIKVILRAGLDHSVPVPPAGANFV